MLVGWTASLYILLQGRVNDPHLHLMFIQIPLLLPLIYLLPHLTKAGAVAREQVQGLAWYIRVAEKARLTFHENPEQLIMKPGKLLAYSVAMNIQKDWKKQFLVGYAEVRKKS